MSFFFCKVAFLVYWIVFFFFFFVIGESRILECCTCIYYFFFFVNLDINNKSNILINRLVSSKSYQALIIGIQCTKRFIGRNDSFIFNIGRTSQQTMLTRHISTIAQKEMVKFFYIASVYFIKQGSKSCYSWFYVYFFFNGIRQ